MGQEKFVDKCFKCGRLLDGYFYTGNLQNNIKWCSRCWFGQDREVFYIPEITKVGKITELFIQLSKIILGITFGYFILRLLHDIKFLLENMYGKM